MALAQANGDTGQQIGVLVIDDHTLLRDGVARILLPEPDIVVVGEAANGDTAVARAEQLQPDVVLLDAEMPGAGPEVTVPGIRSACPTARIVLLTGRPDPVVAAALMALGPSGYLVKDVSAEQLVAAIRTVVREDRTVVASSKASLDGALHQLANLDPRPGLSDREREVLELAARDLTNRQIARRLHMSEATARRHVHSAIQKLHANTRLGAVFRAVTAGLIDPAALVVDPPTPRPPTDRAPGPRLAHGGHCRPRL